MAATLNAAAEHRDAPLQWQLRPHRARSVYEDPMYLCDNSSEDEKPDREQGRGSGRRLKRRKKVDRASVLARQRGTAGLNSNSVMAACAWCHKIENKKKLKRGVTSVVGRPRECWTKVGLPLLYTCCCCYEERRKGRMLDHKKELLKAQYRVFDEFGVEFYEMRKKVNDKWIEWIATSDEVWFELANAYYLLKTFEGIKASPITDTSEIEHARHNQARGRKDSISSVSSIETAASSVFGCPAGGHSDIAEKESEHVSVFMAAEILMDMSGEGSG